jgi:hypothetical protein
MWLATSTATQTIHCDQGAGGTQAIDTLVIPAGHNLSGCTMAFQYSDNDSDWFNAVTGWSQSDNEIIVKQASASSTHRYWRVTIADATAASYCAEVFITLLYTFPDMLMPQNPTRLKDRHALRITSYSGIPHYIKQGDSKIGWSGSIMLKTSTQITNFESFLAAWDGYKAFFITDSASEQYLAELIEEPERSYLATEKLLVRMSLREVG